MWSAYSSASSELRRETNIDVDPETNSTRSNGGTPAQPIRGVELSNSNQTPPPYGDIEFGNVP